MRIIDIHTHIYPDDIAKKATESVKQFYEIGGSDMDGTVSMLLSRGKQAGIDRFRQLRLHPEQLEQIAYKTAANLLKL